VAERLRLVATLVYDRPCVLQDVVGFGGIRHDLSFSLDVLLKQG